MTRDSKGKFTKGHPGGPGRPKREVEYDYLNALSEGVSSADWMKIVKRAVADAAKGNDKARAWLSRYLIGDKIEHVHSGDLSDVSDEELVKRAQAMLARYEGRAV